jgi:hypothetical protein
MFGKSALLAQVFLVTLPLFAQTPSIQVQAPAQRTQTAQPPAILANIPDLAIKSLRLTCVDANVAALRIVTSRETYNVQYPCFPFTCAADTRTCRSGCSENGQCAQGTVCAGGHCVVPTPRCSSDGHFSVSPLGSDKCDPYNCNAASGTCNRDCRTSADCGSGSVCEISARLCVTP